MPALSTIRDSQLSGAVRISAVSDSRIRITMLSRRTMLLGLALLPALSPVESLADPRPGAVIELFTSQGCSSCPPADALLQSYAERSDVVALSLPVDYWDYLGWKDTLASPKYTRRQRAYAKSFGAQPYTPQVVVNGLTHVVGSHAGDIDRAIEKTKAQIGSSRVPLSLHTDGRTLTIDIGSAVSGDETAGTLWLAAVRPRVDIDVRRGENRGRKLSYFNVVRELTPVGMWSGKAAKLELPHGETLRNGERCAAWLQVEATGRIIAAAWLPPR